MINTIKQVRQPIILLCILTLIIGLFFRFTNLDTKVYWGDESVTSLRVSGYTIAELQKKVFTQQEISPQELQEYQYPNPIKDDLDTIFGLASEEPQHPPFYYLLLRLWVKIFGNSIAVTRSLSAVASLLLIPCIYWFCQELFACRLTGWLAMAICAVSPFQIIYAQEARSYALWTLLIVFSNAALLRALRLNNRSSWIIYISATLMGLYTLTLSGVTVICQTIYVIVWEKFKLTKTVKNYLCAAAIFTILFLPWLFVSSSNLIEADETTSWTKQNASFSNLTKTWILNFSRVIFDFNDNLQARNIPFYAIAFLSFALFIYAVYFLIKRENSKKYLLLFITATVFTSLFVLPDLIFGGIRSSVFRYFIPCYLTIQIVIAYLLAKKNSENNKINWQSLSWRAIVVSIFSLGVISCTLSSQSVFWWNKYNAFALPKIAQIVNKVDRPLLVTPWHNMMAFSHILKSEVSLHASPLKSGDKMQTKNRLTSIEPKFSDIFIVGSQEYVNNSISQNKSYTITKKYNWSKQIEPVYKQEVNFWHLSKS